MKDSGTCHMVCRWLLRRIPGVFVLHLALAHGWRAVPDVAKRGEAIATTILPFLSGLLLPEANVRLNLIRCKCILCHAPM